MYRMSRSVITLVALLILLALPLAASARGLETPRPAAAAGESWLGAALDWFQDVLGLRGRGNRHQDAVPTGDVQAKDAAGGPCIDPQGRPKPWCI